MTRCGSLAQRGAQKGFNICYLFIGLEIKFVYTSSYFIQAFKLSSVDVFTQSLSKSSRGLMQQRPREHLLFSAPTVSFQWPGGDRNRF